MIIKDKIKKRPLIRYIFVADQRSDYTFSLLFQDITAKPQNCYSYIFVCYLYRGFSSLPCPNPYDLFKG